MDILHSVFGLFGLIAIAWSISSNKRQFPYRMVLAGLVLQFCLAVIMLKIPAFQAFFLSVNELLLAVQKATIAGTSFVFGYLGGGQLPFPENSPGASFILAFQALPLILVVSALSALLFYWKVLPLIVRGIAMALQKIMGVGGALGLSTAANVFIGMVEAPLFIRPYLRKMTQFEMFALMTCGMATIAGTMMVLYASILSQTIPNAMGHILVASLLSAPAAIVIAAIMVPPDKTVTDAEYHVEQTTASAMDAMTQGTLQGVSLLINIIAMLVVIVALVSLVNMMFGVLPHVDNQPITLQRVFGYLMAPIVWLMGIPWQEASTAGALMGTKLILNEFIAYAELANLKANELSERSQLIMMYALCGFANLGSLGIMIGGIGTMVPERRTEIAALGLRSIVAGTLATMMTGSIVGLLI